MEEYKVLITTSGIGSRLGELTKYTNKSLVRVGKKPGISYIIEKYSNDIELVITLGYYGNQVKDFLTLAYPERKFTFVEIDKFDGQGSSLGYSLLKTKDLLQCPFIFHASDTIVKESIPSPNTNWLGTCNKENHSQYRTISHIKGKMIYDKGDMNSNDVYIGLAGINDYESFWRSLEQEYNLDINDSSLSDCHAINKMNVDKWDVIPFNSWMDIGNVSELKKAREEIGDKFELLDKVDESIFLFDEFVIKFFYDKTICKNRVSRGIQLGDLTPEILDYKDNFYKYKIAKGDLLSSVINEKLFVELLEWSQKNLWVNHGYSDSFKTKCEEFYFDKTNKRLEKFFKDHNIVDSITTINGFEIPKVSDMLNMIDKSWLYSTNAYQFHGDFILDNIIYEGDGYFKLIDWRQDFGGDLVNGDMYYDLAKMNHNLIFNHDIVNRGLFTIENKNNEIKCDILMSNNLSNCREYFKFWLEYNFFIVSKINVLTAIIWLNMAPLHDYKMGEFLFYFGKLNLYKALNKIKK